MNLTRVHPIIASAERNAAWDNMVACRPDLAELVATIGSVASGATQFSFGDRMLAVALASCSAAEGLSIAADAGIGTQQIMGCNPEQIARTLRCAADVYDALARGSRS